MTKRLLIGLLTAVLMATVLPGLTVAKDDGKSDCKKDGWAEWVRDDGSAFADQGECVSYVAEGGTLFPPGPTFQSVCVELGGTNQPSYSDINHNLSPVCHWDSIDFDTWDYLAVVSLWPYCSTGLEGLLIDGEGPWGCEVS
jgi:hypothetical protein